MSRSSSIHCNRGGVILQNNSVLFSLLIFLLAFRWDLSLYVTILFRNKKMILRQTILKETWIIKKKSYVGLQINMNKWKFMPKDQSPNGTRGT